MVTYEQLKSGYILQLRDSLVLHGLDYRVELQPATYYLCCHNRANSRVFDTLGMGAEERKTFVKKFSPIRYAEAQGAFPEFSNLKALTNLVIALYEEPEYKVGDWVTVLPRSEFYDYDPVCYAEEMTKYEGKTYKVTGCSLRGATNTYNGVDTGDPHAYQLNEIGYFWASSMIRKATEEEIDKVKGKVKDSDCYPIKAQKITSERIGALSGETARKLKSQMDNMLESLHCQPVDFWKIPMYAPVCKDTAENTEIRLPKNEEETPHIKL